MKRFLHLALATLSSLVFTIPSFAYSFKVDGILYEVLSDMKVEVTYSEEEYYTGSVNIPTTVMFKGVSYSVTSIGRCAFTSCSGLTSVTIGNSVTSIGEKAFYGCSGLTSLTIPNSVTSIGEYAFYGCSGLTSLTIPNSVTSIGEYAFYGCTRLTSVTIPNSVSSIGRSAFSDCSGLSSVIIGNSVTSIGEYAFYGCSGLTSLTIPNSVTSIGNYAFHGCSGLKELVLQDGESTLKLGYNYYTKDKYKKDQGLFYDCPLEKLYLGRNLTYDITDGYDTSPFYMKSTLALLTIGNSVTSIDSHAFYGCSELTSVTFGNSVTSIGYYAFSSCSRLTSVTFGNSVTSIGNYAFYDCSGLTSVSIGNSVTSIGNYAFSGCSELSSLTISNSVTSIDTNAFEACSELLKLVILSNGSIDRKLDLYQKLRYVENRIIYVADNSYSSYYSTFGTVHILPFLRSIFKVDGVKYVPLSPSERTCIAIDCTYDKDDTAINIDKTVSFNGVTLTVEEIGKHTLRNNDYIQSVTVSVETDIPDYFAYGCNGIKTVELNNVDGIGVSAFKNCSNLEIFSIGENVKTIGEAAFSNCTAMTSLTAKPDTPPTCGTHTLDDINKWNCTLYVDEESIPAYQAADQWKDFFFIKATSIEKIVTDSKNEMFTVYNLSGNLIMNKVGANALYKLHPGIYVINGKKIMIK